MSAKLFSVLYFFSVIIFLSCSSNNHTEANQDSTVFVNEHEVSSTSLGDTLAEEGIEEFNEQDNGDPGLDGLIVNEQDQTPEVRELLASLRSNMVPMNMVSGKTVLTIRSGPGIYPVFDFREPNTSLADLEAFSTYLGDSVFEKSLTYYTLVHDKCTIIDSFPEGVYFNTFNFKDRQFESVDESENLELKSFLTQFENTDEGVEFIIKFGTKAGKETFLHLLTYLHEGHLVIAIVDQRDCSA